MNELSPTAGPKAQEQPSPGSSLESPVRRLRRPKDDRVLFGVAAGLGRYLGIDPVIVRIAFLVLLVFGGSGLLLYLIGLVAISAEQPGDPAPAPGASTPPNAVVVLLGAALIALGGLLLAARLVPGFGDLVGPVLLIGLGLVVLLAVRR